MSGTPGVVIGGATGPQPPIGAYVQDTVHPNGDTNFIGCNPEIGYAANPGIPIATTCPVNSGSAQTTKNAVFCSSAVVLVPTDKVTISSGVATKDNSTGTHNVLANVPAAGFFWAVLI
jgi:hypothetical protein